MAHASTATASSPRRARAFSTASDASANSGDRSDDCMDRYSTDRSSRSTKTAGRHGFVAFRSGQFIQHCTVFVVHIGHRRRDRAQGIIMNIDKVLDAFVYYVCTKRRGRVVFDFGRSRPVTTHSIYALALSISVSFCILSSRRSRMTPCRTPENRVSLIGQNFKQVMWHFEDFISSLPVY